jgi:hypothetical protein
MSLGDDIKAVVQLVADIEDKSAIVRLAVVDNEFIATVEVHDGEGEDAEACSHKALLDDAEEQINALGRRLTQDERDLIGDVLLLARNVTERGDVRSDEGHGRTPEGAVANLHEILRKGYKEMLDEMESQHVRRLN